MIGSVKPRAPPAVDRSLYKPPRVLPTDFSFVILFLLSDQIPAVIATGVQIRNAARGNESVLVAEAVGIVHAVAARIFNRPLARPGRSCLRLFLHFDGPLIGDHFD